MKNKRLLIVLLTLVNLANAIAVYTLDEQLFQMNQTVLRFKVVNNSNDTISNIELRYRVIQDTSLIAEPDLYYFPEGMANWSFDDSINATLVIYFPDAILYPGDTLGGASGYALGLHNDNWTAWSKNDDPSQPKSNLFSIANNVEILSDGKVLMQDAGKNAGCPVVQFVEIGKDSVSLQVLQLLKTDSSSIVIKNKDGFSINANLKKTEKDSLEQKIWRGFFPTQDTTERRGELRAECNGNLLAYFAYGWKPSDAIEAVAKNLWESTETFVKADFDMGFNQGLVEGQRLVLRKDSVGRFMDARRTENWKFYRAWEEPGENPIPIIWSPAVMQYDENDIDSLTLEWSPLENINWYHLLVIRDSLIEDSVVFVDTVSMFTKRTSVRIPVLQVGNYVWFVEPFIEVPNDENDEGEEYFYVSGDEAISGNRPMLRGLFTKLKRTAVNAVTTAIKHMHETKNSNKKMRQTVVVGAIKILSNAETLLTRVNNVSKDMNYLSKSYVKKYVYSSDTNRIDEFFSNKCFGVKAFCAMKDTKMLAEDWNVGFDSNNWNKIFPKKDVNGSINKSVRNRCWLTMAQMINHYKGGNIASDEILYNVRGGFNDTSSSNPVESMQAVRYALNQDVWDEATYTTLINAYRSKGFLPSVDDWTVMDPNIHTILNVSIDGWFVGTPRLNTIISTIESGNVMGVSQLNGGASGGHAMVLNGYKIKGNGNVYIHLLNTHNMGEDEWRYYCNISYLGMDIVARFIVNGIGQFVDFLRTKDDDDFNVSGDMFFTYYIPPLYAKGREANAMVFDDSDGDDIVNFDETERFGTDPMNPDSDGDGVNDYEEILDYKKCETYSNKFMPFIYAIDSSGYEIQYEVNASQLSFKAQSDFDGDGFHVAIDPDSDGDGFCDNQEKGYLKNGNAHNCERFDASKHPVGEVPKCKDYSVALLAKEKLQMNDKAVCITLNNSFCPIASYERNYENDYGVRLGVRTFVGNVYSAKSVLMRDKSFVFGNLETGGEIVKQSSSTGVIGQSIEHSPSVEVHSSYYANLLNSFITNTDFTINYQRVINAGATFYSNEFGLSANHGAYNFNSNSELRINTNYDLHLGSLKFQYGAKLYAPPENIVFHIGDDFQWNGTVVADDMVSAAQHILVYYFGTNRVFVQTNFAGTIIAPNAEVVVGQSGKRFYGAIYAKSIVIHQNTRFIWVPFVPVQTNNAIAWNGSYEIPNYTISFLGR